MRQLVTEIIASIENEPERWWHGAYTFNRDDGLKIWNANCYVLNKQIYAPGEISLSLREKFALASAITKWGKTLSLDQFMQRGLQP